MSGMTSALTYTTEPEDDGKSAYLILREKMGVSEAIVRHARRIDCGVTLDGRPSRTDALVREGQVLGLHLLDNGRSTSIAPEPGPLSIVFEDEHVLILDKPAGLVVHPSRGHFTSTLCNFVAHHLESQGASAIPHPVNRLDRETSGLVVFAKHAHAQNILQAQLHTGSFERSYLAVCEGSFAQMAGVVDAPIARLKDEYGSFGISPDGKRAVTRYRVLAHFPQPSDEGASLSAIQLELETGRTHQIRVHMSHVGHPLLGDSAYGSPSALIDRCALHSWKLQLTHPITKARLGFSAVPPEDIASLLPSSPLFA